MVLRECGIGKNYVIHTVGPIWRDGKRDEDTLLFNAIVSAFKMASELDQKSISIPAISTGIFGYPLERACRQIALGTKAYLDNCTNTLVLFY